MIDGRFETPVTDIDHLLEVVDIDEIEDLETTLMILFARPIEVCPELDDDGDEIGVEVLVFGDTSGRGTVLSYPVNVLDLVRVAAENAEELGPYTRRPTRLQPHTGLATGSDAELIRALQPALGSVRIASLLEDGA